MQAFSAATFNDVQHVAVLKDRFDYIIHDVDGSCNF